MPSSDHPSSQAPLPWILCRSTLPADGPLAVPPRGLAVLIDKERGWTSFDVVAKLRSIFRIRKIGHAGTLDPMATGLLVACAGKATKQISRFMGMTKEYLATIRLGETTESWDAETRIIQRRPLPDVDRAALQTLARRFTGRILQIPPMYSARKVDGKRLYELARKGVTIEREAKEVEVERFEILALEGADVEARIVCSKGTYVRSLAHDFAEELGCGGHLTQLRRQAIGALHVDEALRTDELARLQVRRPGRGT